jgi:hypothetical protein
VRGRWLLTSFDCGRYQCTVLSRGREDAAREFLARRSRAVREARDLEILNAAADALNREMKDILAYQANT